MKKVIILNGPPLVGKDTYGKILCELYDANHCEFKRELIRETEKYFNLGEGYILRNYEYKDKYILADKGNRTIRECLIHVSEEVCKPQHGNDYFGKKALSQLKEGLNVFTDGGFEEEIQPLINEVGKENIIIVKIHREGFDYSKDSRNYLDIEGIDTFFVGETIDEKPFVMWEILTELGLKDLKC